MDVGRWEANPVDLHSSADAAFGVVQGNSPSSQGHAGSGQTAASVSGNKLQARCSEGSGVASSTGNEEQDNKIKKEKERAALLARRDVIYRELKEVEAELIAYRDQHVIPINADTETEEGRIRRERVEAAIELRKNKKARLQWELTDVNTDVNSLKKPS